MFGKNHVGGIHIKDKLIACPLCGNTCFKGGHASLASDTSHFFNTEWMSATGYYYECMDCSHILWFREEKILQVIPQQVYASKAWQ